METNRATIVEYFSLTKDPVGKCFKVFLCIIPPFTNEGYFVLQEVSFRRRGKISMYQLKEKKT